DQLIQYDLRLQTTTETYNAISKDGVSVTATINIRYTLDHDSIPYLHEAVGSSYLSTLVKPEIGSRTRQVIADYYAEQVYSTKRQEIEAKIRQVTQDSLNSMMINRLTAVEPQAGKCPPKMFEFLLKTALLRLHQPYNSKEVEAVLSNLKAV